MLLRYNFLGAGPKVVYTTNHVTVSAVFSLVISTPNIYSPLIKHGCRLIPSCPNFNNQNSVAYLSVIVPGIDPSINNGIAVAAALYSLAMGSFGAFPTLIDDGTKCQTSQVSIVCCRLSLRGPPSHNSRVHNTQCSLFYMKASGMLKLDCNYCSLITCIQEY